MTGIGVVLNPRARHNLRDPDAALRLARRLGDHGVLREAHSIDELYRIAEDFRKVDIDVLAISGGDGTNTVTLTGFIDVYGGSTMPQVALLRGGTMNTVANSVGVRHGQPEGLLGKLIRDYAHRANAPLENVERHVMHVAPAVGGRPQYGFLFGTGVVHGFLAEYYKDGQPTPLVAAKILLRAVASAAIRGPMIRRMAEPFTGSVTFDDDAESDSAKFGRWPQRQYLAVAAGTIAHIGLNFRPFHRYLERPGRFHALAITASPFEFVKELPRIHTAKPMRPGKAFEGLWSRMTVRSATGRCAYMIDGDLHETTGDLVVSTGPRVRLVILR